METTASHKISRISHELILIGHNLVQGKSSEQEIGIYIRRIDRLIESISGINDQSRRFKRTMKEGLSLFREGLLFLLESEKAQTPEGKRHIEKINRRAQSKIQQAMNQFKRM